MLVHLAVFSTVKKLEEVHEIATCFFLVLLQQCSKKASASLLWLLKSSSIIANRPWPRISLTVITTAIILTMAVFNMVSRASHQAGLLMLVLVEL